MLYVIIPLLTKLQIFHFFLFYMAYLMTFEFIIAVIFIYYYQKLKNLMERHRNEEFNNIKLGL